MVYLDGNQLVGPAFPPAWIAPNSSLDLWHFMVARNPGLNGTLPPDLDWLSLKGM